MRSTPRSASIIMGDGSGDVLRSVSKSLKAKTLASSGSFRTTYTPWMCAYPVVPVTDIPGLLLDGAFTPQGVVSDEQYLSAVSNFMTEHHDLMIEPLIGSDDDWAIHTAVAADRQEMVVELELLIAMVRRCSPFFDVLIPSVLEMVIPLSQPRARGLSSDLYRGVVFLGYPPGYSDLNLALDLTHELGHQAIGLLRSCDPLFASDPGALVYSEVRHTERPAMQSLHAASAIAFMLRFALDFDAPFCIHPDFDIPLDEALRRGLNSLKAACTFTEVGLQIISDFEQLLTEVPERSIAAPGTR